MLDTQSHILCLVEQKYQKHIFRQEQVENLSQSRVPNIRVRRVDRLQEFRVYDGRVQFRAGQNDDDKEYRQSSEIVDIIKNYYK